MAAQLEPLARMVTQLARLPGVGPKTAQRLAYHMLCMPLEEVRTFAEALYNGRKRIHSCVRCGNWTDADLCAVCSDPRRRQDVLCVLRDPRDVAALERMGEYAGQYHVLGGTISPLEGRGPEDIRIPELMSRVRDGHFIEVILATAADVEGEATASYVAYMLKPLGVKVTRLAQGLPIGGDLEYADEVTLSRALQGRREV